jgi:cysteine synthase A
VTSRSPSPSDQPATADRAGIASSALDAIGTTPLVALDRLTRGLDGRILAKLEMLNPGGSKKDRPARQIVLDARECGDLAPGQTVVELTSGNMGTGLAIACAVLGHPFVAVMSRGNSAERARMMRALGAEVVLVEQAPGSRPGEVSGADLALVEAAAQRLTVERAAFRADQFRRHGNDRAHYLGTAPEIWSQTGGAFDVFCDFVGSGGTFTGCARFFKERRPDIRCYVVEPAGAAVLAGRPVTRPDHPIQGGGYAMPDLELLDRTLLDECLEVTGEAAEAAARRLAREEGIFAGYSTGANVAAALQLLEGPQRGATIVVLACDSGLKYLSTDLWP